MNISLRPTQIIQLQSFWNLIQTADEGVQKELFELLQQKYSTIPAATHKEHPSFLQMEGILGKGSSEKDKQMLNDYLSEKYKL